MNDTYERVPGLPTRVNNEMTPELPSASGEDLRKLVGTMQYAEQLGNGQDREDAFTELYLNTYNFANSCAAALIEQASPDDVAVIVQEAYLNIWLTTPRIDLETPFAEHLFVGIKNAVNNSKQLKDKIADLEPESVMENMVSTEVTTNPELQACKNCLDNEIRMARELMSDENKIILDLQIAGAGRLALSKELGLPVGDSDKRLSEARQVMGTLIGSKFTQ